MCKHYLQNIWNPRTSQAEAIKRESGADECHAYPILNEPGRLATLKAPAIVAPGSSNPSVIGVAAAAPARGAATARQERRGLQDA
jgi:hypothetical protein